MRRRRTPEAGPNGPSEAESVPRHPLLGMLRKLPRRRWLALALALVGVASAVLAGTVLAAGTTFIVNSTGDAPDANLSDGQCQTATSNECTLRAAIQQANNLSTNAGLDTIKFNIPGSGVKR